MEDVAGFVLVKHTDTGLLFALEFHHFIVVVHLTLRHFVLGGGDVKVEVEVASIRRYPLEPPAHASLKPFDLGLRRPRDRDECDVVMFKVDTSAVDMIGQKRAAFAALLPSRSEHEMVDNQLAASIEQVGQPLLSVWAIELVLFVDLEHRQPAAFGADGISLTGQFLFLNEQPLASDQPVSSRDNLRPTLSCDLKLTGLRNDFDFSFIA